MPLQNRVTPEGALVAAAARGAWMGNRGGRLHGDDRTLGRRRWSNRRWICCRLAFKGRHRTVMGAGYTEMFFLDEATALAAGHRPCFECRRDEALAFAAAFGAVRGLGRNATADEMDAVLHAERVADDGGKRTFAARPGLLPDGAMFRLGNIPVLKRNGRLAAWTLDGYNGSCAVASVDDAPVEVLTPGTIVHVLAAGYVPRVHASAERSP
ncbi:MAG: hypothetical protein ACOYLQ_01520 [Hyphomicrobiaceae bacterium]